MSAPVDLSPAGLAAQAQAVVYDAIMRRATLAATGRAKPYDPVDVLAALPDAIAAALSAVRDAVRAEREQALQAALESKRAWQKNAEDSAKGSAVVRAERDQLAEEVRQLQEALEAAHARNIRWQQEPTADPVDALTEILDITAIALARYILAAPEPSHG